MELRPITPQGGRIGSSSLWSTTGVKPRGRYNLILNDRDSTGSCNHCRYQMGEVSFVDTTLRDMPQGLWAEPMKTGEGAIFQQADPLGE